MRQKRKQMSQEEQEQAQVEHETDIVALMAKSEGIARGLFDEKGDHLRATLEIYDYLNCLDGDEDGEQIFAADLKRTCSYAVEAFGIADGAHPTPEQVFELFDRIFPTDEE